MKIILQKHITDDDLKSMIELYGKIGAGESRYRESVLGFFDGMYHKCDLSDKKLDVLHDIFLQLEKPNLVQIIYDYCDVVQ